MKFILMILLLLSSALIAAWFMLLFKSNQEDAVSAAYDKLLSNTLRIDKLRKKDALKAAALKQYDGIVHSFMKLFSGSHEKEITKLEAVNDELRGGNVGKAGIITLPGHVLRRSYALIGEGKLYKTLQLRHIELHGKKNAVYKTNGVLAAMCS